VEEALPALLPRLSTADVCSLVWAAARLQVEPDASALEAVAAELTRPGYRSAAAAVEGGAGAGGGGGGDELSGGGGGGAAAAARWDVPQGWWMAGGGVSAAAGGGNSSGDGGGAAAGEASQLEERRRSHAGASRSSGGGGRRAAAPQAGAPGARRVYSYSRLQLAAPRDLAAVAYAFDFFKFNAPPFWAAAAEAALPELPGLAPAALANLLTGVAHSCVVAARAAAAGGSGGGGGDGDGAEGAAAAAAAAAAGVAAAGLEDVEEDWDDWGLDDVVGGEEEEGEEGEEGEQDEATAAEHEDGGEFATAGPLRRAPGALAGAPAAAAPAARRLFAAAASLLLEERRRLDRFRPRDLAALVAAFATAGHPAPALFAEVSRHLLLDPTGRRLGALRGRDAALMAWAYAHALCGDAQLLAALAGVLRRRARELPPQRAALALWAFAAAGGPPPDEAALRAIAGAAAGRLHAVHAPVAAGVAWSLGRLGLEAPALLEDALDAVAAAMEGAAHWEAPAGGGAAACGGQEGAQSDCGGGAATGGAGGPAAAAASGGGGGGGRSVLEELLANPALAEGGGGNAGSGPAAAALPAARPWAPPRAAGAAPGLPPPAPLLPQDAAHAMWSCGRLLHWNGGFLAALKRRLPDMLASGALGPHHLVALLWAAARLRYTSYEFVAPLCAKVGVCFWGVRGGEGCVWCAFGAFAHGRRCGL
jgi:hypothetical protein